MQNSEKALKMLKTALDMEEKGMAFYEKASNSCKNEFGKKMFRSLYEDEVAHKERIRKIYASLESDNAWAKDWDSFKGHTADLNKMFSDFTKKNGTNIKADAGDIEALDVGIDLEQKAINYYSSHLKNATDPVERSFTEKMVIEERGHFALISDTKMYLTNPVAWFTEHERSSLDGV